MNTKRQYLLSAAALLLLGACSSSRSGPAPSGSAAPGASSVAKKGDAVPGVAALASPDENYVAAGAKIACAGVELDSADAMTKERDKVLKAHGYTEESWVVASKQFGKAKAEAVVGAMKCAP